MHLLPPSKYTYKRNDIPFVSIAKTHALPYKLIAASRLAAVRLKNGKSFRFPV
jgi:hypothetical protein